MPKTPKTPTLSKSPKTPKTKGKENKQKESKLDSDSRTIKKKKKRSENLVKKQIREEIKHLQNVTAISPPPASRGQILFFKYLSSSIYLRIIRRIYCRPFQSIARRHIR